jgi:hypothetical protein
LSELHALVIPLEGEARLMTRASEREIAKLDEVVGNTSAG